MAGLNKVQIIGYLGRDPEMKYTQNGKAVTSFSVGVSDRKDGPTTWFECQAWEKSAEILNQYGSKGKLIYAEGRLEIQDYEKDGEKRRSVRVVVRDFQFLSRGEDEGGNGRQNSRQPAAAASRQSAPDDDYLPF